MGKCFFLLLSPKRPGQQPRKLNQRLGIAGLRDWHVSMPEWLRGQTRNLMGSARVGSNPAANDAGLDGRAVQGASFRHWSLRRRGFESHSNHAYVFFFFFSQQPDDSAAVQPEASTRRCTLRVGWPSGPRRQFKALVSSEAWVRIPLQSYIPVSLVGQDTRLSPARPGFKSRTGNFLPKRRKLGQISDG